MGNVLQMLSDLGACSAHDSRALRVNFIAGAAGLDEAVERAIIDGNVAELERQLGARNMMRCLVLCPDELH